MIRRGGIGAFLVVLIAAPVLFASEVRASSHKSTVHREDQVAGRRRVNIPIAGFSLTDQSGNPFGFQSLRGKVALVIFVYTTCPDVCPLLTSRMVLVQKNLQAKERPSVFLLGITTDPEVDSPQVLKEYAGRYGVDFSNWSFLTGSQRELAPVWKSFGVQVQRKARGLVNHTPLTALVDGQGIMRFTYSSAAPDHNTILRDIRSLLASP